MSQFTLDPKSASRPYLVAGEYGPGRAFEADCEISKFEIPASENPRYDKDGARGPYAYFEIKVRSEERGFNTLFHHEPIGENSGSRVLGWLVELGHATPDGTIADTDMVAGTKVVVTVGDPRQDANDPNRYYNGRLLGLSAV